MTCVVYNPSLSINSPLTYLFPIIVLVAVQVPNKNSRVFNLHYLYGLQVPFRIAT